MYFGLLSALSILLSIVTVYVDGQRPGVIPVEVPLGRRVVLECRPTLADVNSISRYEWRRRDRVIGEGKTFLIPSITLNDAGIYVCRIYYRVNGVIQQQDASHELRLKNQDDGGFAIGGGANRQQEFRFLIRNLLVKDTAVFNQTSWIFLKCETNNGANYKWTGPNNFIRNGQILYFPNANKSHEGMYTCTASIDGIGELSDQIRVEVRSIEVRMISYPGEKFEVGGRISRTCLASLQSLNSNLQVKWLDPNGQVIAEGSLINLEISERTQSGRYTCQLFKYGSTQPLAIKTFDVSIKSGRTPRVEAPQLTVKQIPKQAVEGESVSLICQSNVTLTNMNYAWYKNGALTMSGPYLMVSTFSPEDSVYECRVSGSDPQTGVSFQGSASHVIVHTVPKKQIEMTTGLQTAVVREGDSKELHCEIDSGDGLENEQPTTKWFFNNQELTPNSLRQYGLAREDHSYTSILSVRSFRKDNDGMYACLRKDGSRMQVRIIVEKLKGHLEVSPEIITTDVGSPAEFHCQISTSTINSELKWLFEPRNSGRRLEIDFSRWVRHDSPTTPQTSFIELENAQNRDDGFYHCSSEKDQLYGKAELVIRKRGSSKSIIITPDRVTVRPQVPIRMFCRVSVNGIPGGRPKFYFTNNRPVDTTPSFTQRNGANGEVELIVAGGLDRDAGQVEVICRDGPDEKRGLIIVTTDCPPGQRACRDGRTCIPQTDLCNGVRDCPDGSDEDPSYCKKCDPLTKKCGDYNGRAPLKSFYQAHWECDGEDDCGNSFDESNCNRAEFTSCGGTTHQCERQINMTIPRAFMCDNENDCPGGTDESRCSMPQITSPSPSPYRVTLNGRVTLTCRATGRPLPRIIWRFNWGCLPDEKRMVTMNNNNNCFEAVSRLEISEFQRGDDGIYNCEALIGQKRILSNDYFVTLG